MAQVVKQICLIDRRPMRICLIRRQAIVGKFVILSLMGKAEQFEASGSRLRVYGVQGPGFADGTTVSSLNNAHNIAGFSGWV